MKQLWCFFMHRRWHTVTRSSGIPYPFDPVYDWFCPLCDKMPGRRVRPLHYFDLAATA